MLSSQARTRTVPVLMLGCALATVVPMSPQSLSSDVSAEQLIAAEHWKKARTLVESRLKVTPNDAHAAFLMSQIKVAFNDLDGALSMAERSVAGEGHDADHLAQLAQVNALLAERGPWTKGIGYVRQLKRNISDALASNPNHVDALLVDMMFSFKAPMLVGGDKRKAHAIADRMVQTSPAWGYLAQARLAQEEQNDSAAEQALVKGVQAEPGNYRVKATLALFYCCVMRNRKLDAAERWAKEAMKLDPRQSAAYSVLARVYAAQSRWQDLEAVLANAERSNPDDLAPYYAASRELMEQGKDLARAEAYLRKYMAAEPEGRAPTPGEARWTLGLIYEKLGRKSDAATELMAALRLQPDLEAARRDLKRMR